MSVKGTLDKCRSHLKYHEGYNNDTPFGKRFKLNHEPWCDMFLCCCAEDAGEKAAMGWYAGTESHEAWFRVHGHLTKSHNEIERGFVVFWDWNLNDRPNHVEIVEEAYVDHHGNVIELKTIGGNTGPNSQYVWRQVRNLHYWLSCGKPQYSNHSTAWPGKLLVLGSHNDAVRRMQKKLDISADGIFGKKTLAAVKDFQHDHKLTVDGQAGLKTWGALF